MSAFGNCVRQAGLAIGAVVISAMIGLAGAGEDVSIWTGKAKMIKTYYDTTWLRNLKLAAVYLYDADEAIKATVAYRYDISKFTDDPARAAQLLDLLNEGKAQLMFSTADMRGFEVVPAAAMKSIRKTFEEMGYAGFKWEQWEENPKNVYGAVEWNVGMAPAVPTKFKLSEKFNPVVHLENTADYPEVLAAVIKASEKGGLKGVFFAGTMNVSIDSAVEFLSSTNELRVGTPASLLAVSVVSEDDNLLGELPENRVISWNNNWIAVTQTPKGGVEFIPPD